MAKFIVTIDLDNAAFEGVCLREELARILNELSFNVQVGEDLKRNLRDVNGNTVGRTDIVDHVIPQYTPPGKWHGDRMD